MPDYAARIRAARGFADLTQSQLAEALGVEVQTVKRRESGPGHKDYKEPKKGERLAIAQICGVPPSFMENGFDGEARSEMGERLDEIADQLREVVAHRVEASEDVQKIISDPEAAREVFSWLVQQIAAGGRDRGRRELQFRAAADRLAQGGSGAT